MKKLNLSLRHKRIAIQLALLIPIVIITGVNLLYPSILILSALAIRGLISLYVNDPYFKDNAEQISALNNQPTKYNRIDPQNTYLGLKCYTLRKRIYGY